MKNKFSTHVSYFWWVYVLIAIAFVLIWSYSMDAALRPKATEKLRITVFADNINTDELNSQLPEILPEITEQEIIEIRVGSIKDELTDPSLLNTLLYARAQESDFMIVEESAITEEKFAPAYFYAVEETAIQDAFGNVEFWREESNGTEYSYGILLNGNGAKNNFTQYYGSENRCWLFFCFKHDNMGGVTGKGKTANNAALRTIKWLLTEVN